MAMLAFAVAATIDSLSVNVCQVTTIAGHFIRFHRVTKTWKLYGKGQIPRLIPKVLYPRQLWTIIDVLHFSSSTASNKGSFFVRCQWRIFCGRGLLRIRQFMWSSTAVNQYRICHKETSVGAVQFGCCWGKFAFFTTSAFAAQPLVLWCSSVITLCYHTDVDTARHWMYSL